MTTESITPPPLKDGDRRLAQPWFETSGLDETSAEWGVTWSALVSAHYASANGLILWPRDSEDLLTRETRATLYVTTALAAGAAYAALHPAVNAGVGVEVVLGLLDKRPELIELVLSGDLKERVGRVLSAAAECVIGVFASAPQALAAMISTARAELSTSPDSGQAWPPLIEVIAQEATHDDVFAEHVVVQLSVSDAHNIDYLLLTSGNWLLYRPW